MKWSKLFTLFLICVSGNLSAQHCSENINTPLGSTINVFDWTQDYYDFVLGLPSNVEEVTVQSPFFDGDSNDNIYHLNDEVEGLKDFMPEQGWELVLHRFGSRSLNPGEPDQPVPTPVLVLYNRYEGVLRVLVWIRQGADGYNEARLTLKFASGENKQNANLSLIDIPIKSLDRWTRDNIMASPNTYLNLPTGYWLFADYPIIYDPCACDHESTLQVRADLINVNQISLDMEGGGNIEQVIGSGSSSSSVSLREIADGITKSGTRVKKNFDGYVTAVEGIQGAYNLLFSSKNGTTDYNVLSESNQKKVDEDTKKNAKIPDWTKTLPKIGFVFGIAQYLIGGGKKEKPKPITFEANLQFNISGTDTDVDGHGAADFYTPGSEWNSGSNPERQVVYNNLLGVVGLLTTPEVLKEEVTVDVQDPLPGDPNHIYTDYSYKFKLNNNIDFAVNPAAGLRVVDTKAALVFEACESPVTMFNLDYNSGLSPTPSVISLLEHNTANDRWQTPFYPLSCMNEIVINTGFTGIRADGYGSCYNDARVKLLVTLERDPSQPFYDPDADRVMFMAEFETDITSAVIPDLDNDFDRILLSETITDLTLTEDQTIYAWSTITIEPGSIMTNDHILTLVAGAEIIGAPNSDQLENVDLIIGYPEPCQGIADPVSPIVIDGFCENTYDPIGAAGPQSEVYYPSATSDNTLDLELVAAPNPFNDFIQLEYTSPIAEVAEVTVVDALGRTVDVFVLEMEEETRQQFKMDTANWASGFYILTFKTESGQQTIKLVKNN